MINVTEHYVTDLQDYKASITDKIDEIKRLILENVTGNETTKIKIRTPNRTLKMEIILKVSELL